jgi:hypothetical protein
MSRLAFAYHDRLAWCRELVNWLTNVKTAILTDHHYMRVVAEYTAYLQREAHLAAERARAQAAQEQAYAARQQAQAAREHAQAAHERAHAERERVRIEREKARILEEQNRILREQNYIKERERRDAQAREKDRDIIIQINYDAAPCAPHGQQYAFTPSAPPAYDDSF